MRIDLDRAAGGYRSRPTARQQRSAPAAPGHRSCCESVQQHHLSAVPQMKARGARSNTCAPSPSITALGHPSPCFLLICCCRPSSARATRTEHPFLRPVRPSSRQPLARPDRRLGERSPSPPRSLSVRQLIGVAPHWLSERSGMTDLLEATVGCWQGCLPGSTGRDATRSARGLAGHVRNGSTFAFSR